MGLTPGDRVAVLAANRVELLAVTVGTLRAGIVPVPISPLLTRTGHPDSPDALHLRHDGPPQGRVGRAQGWVDTPITLL
ncbi:MAG: AMP-binding protein [Actinomycetota bacterium]